MDIKPIETEAEYDAALAEIDRLMEAVPETPEGDRLDRLVTLVEFYEASVFPIEDPSPGAPCAPPSPARGEGS